MPTMISCNTLKISGDSFWSYSFLSQVNSCENMPQIVTQNHPKVNHVKSILFGSKIKLAHGLISFQRKWASFLHNSTLMQGNKKTLLQTILKGFLC